VETVSSSDLLKEARRRAGLSQAQLARRAGKPTSVIGRVNVTLDPERAEKLAKLAERTHEQEGTLARSLLSQALDEAEEGAPTAAE